MVACWERRLELWSVAHWDYRWYSYLVTTRLTTAILRVIYFIIILGGYQIVFDQYRLNFMIKYTSTSDPQCKGFPVPSFGNISYAPLLC